MTATDRIKEYLDYKGIPVYQAEKSCGVSNSSISKALKPGATTMKSDTLEKFLSTYTDLSAEWVLRGTGKMLISDGIDPAQVFRALNMPPNSQKIIDVWLKFMEVTEGMQEIYKQSM